MAEVRIDIGILQQLLEAQLVNGTSGVTPTAPTVVHFSQVPAGALTLAVWSQGIKFTRSRRRNNEESDMGVFEWTVLGLTTERGPDASVLMGARLCAIIEAAIEMKTLTDSGTTHILHLNETQSELRNDEVEGLEALVAASVTVTGHVVRVSGATIATRP